MDDDPRATRAVRPASVTSDSSPRVGDGPGWVRDAVPGDIVTAQQARWGFRHETWIVELTGGRRIVLQRRVDGSDPTVRGARVVRDLVRAARVPTPEPLRRPTAPGGTGVVVELPFVDAQVAADLLQAPRGAATVGRLCGSIAARLGTVDVVGIELADTWTSGARLRAAAARWMALLPAPVPASTRASVERALTRASSMLDVGSPRLAHGDLAPVNVLVRDESVAAVLDLDRAQLAHPAYDAAWFAWVLNFHHPAVAGIACAAYMAVTGVPTSEAALGWLWPLLLLERLAETAGDEERAMWVERLVSPRAPIACT